MPETALVTVQTAAAGQDYSLPLQQPICQWLEALVQSVLPGEKASDYVIVYQNSSLDEKASLAEYSVWDGAVLKLQKIGGL